MKTRFEKKRALVTGAAGGLGRAIALRLADLGWRVAVSDIDEEGLAETLAEIVKRGAKGLSMRVDVAKPADVAHMAAEVEKAWEGIDLLVNNAGVAVGGKVGEISLKDWEWIVGINLWGVIYGCHTFIPKMREQGGGQILNVASSAGIVSAPEMAPYNVTKAGVISLSETLRAELRGDNIGVTALCPTFLVTGIHKAMRASDERSKKVASNLVTKSKWTADQIAKIAVAAALKNKLYVIPQTDGKFAWLSKRVMPTGFYGIIGRGYARGLVDKLAK